MLSYLNILRLIFVKAIYRNCRFLHFRAIAKNATTEILIIKKAEFLARLLIKEVFMSKIAYVVSAIPKVPK